MSTNFENFLKEQMKDPEFKKAWDEFGIDADNTLFVFDDTMFLLQDNNEKMNKIKEELDKYMEEHFDCDALEAIKEIEERIANRDPDEMEGVHKEMIKELSNSNFDTGALDVINEIEERTANKNPNEIEAEYHPRDIMEYNLMRGAIVGTDTSGIKDKIDDIESKSKEELIAEFNKSIKELKKYTHEDITMPELYIRGGGILDGNKIENVSYYPEDLKDKVDDEVENQIEKCNNKPYGEFEHSVDYYLKEITKLEDMNKHLADAFNKNTELLNLFSEEELLSKLEEKSKENNSFDDNEKYFITNKSLLDDNVRYFIDNRHLTNEIENASKEYDVLNADYTNLKVSYNDQRDYCSSLAKRLDAMRKENDELKEENDRLKGSIDGGTIENEIDKCIVSSDKNLEEEYKRVVKENKRMAYELNTFAGRWAGIVNENTKLRDENNRLKQEKFIERRIEELNIIKIKYLTDIEKIKAIDKGDWIDLRAAQEVELEAGESYCIPLGIAMELPKGYEAHIVPRSSTFKKWGIIQANSTGIIDNSYCGDGDEWGMPVYATRDTVIHKNDRICQFRIVENQPKVNFIEVPTLGNENRGGFGSTGHQ